MCLLKCSVYLNALVLRLKWMIYHFHSVHILLLLYLFLLFWRHEMKGIHTYRWIYYWFLAIFCIFNMTWDIYWHMEIFVTCNPSMASLQSQIHSLWYRQYRTLLWNYMYPRLGHFDLGFDCRYCNELLLAYLHWSVLDRQMLLKCAFECELNEWTYCGIIWTDACVYVWIFVYYSDLGV